MIESDFRKTGPACTLRSRVTGTRIHACLPPLWDLGSRHSPRSMHTGFWWQWSCGQKRQCGGTWGWAVVWPPLRLLGSPSDLLVWPGRCGPALWPWQQRREVITGVGWGAVLPVHCPLSPCSGSRGAPRVRGALISGGHHQCGHSSCLPPLPHRGSGPRARRVRHLDACGGDPGPGLSPRRPLPDPSARGCV